MPDSQKIQSMFSDIAPNYDCANEVLSLGMYKKWYKRLIKKASPKDFDSIIDLATGTGNLAIAFKSHNRTLKITGVDFSENMVSIADIKSKKLGLDIDWKLGDATHLNFPDDYFDIATISFGIRNVDSIENCLREMARIVKSNGKILILEFGSPFGLVKGFYKFYSRFIIPLLGGLITKNRTAYTYLNKSSLQFPSGKDFLEIILKTGLFKNVYCEPIFMGIAYLYYADVN